MLTGEVQIEIQRTLEREKIFGFLRAAFLRIGTAVTSTCVMCQVALSRPAMCSTLTPTRTLIAAVSAQSCRFCKTFDIPT